MFYASYGPEVIRQALLDLMRLANRSQWIGFKYKHIDEDLTGKQIEVLKRTLAEPNLDSVSAAVDVCIDAAAAMTPLIVDMYKITAPTRLIQQICARTEKNG